MEKTIENILRKSDSKTNKNSLLSRSKDIIKVLFFGDLILLIVMIFFSSKTLAIISIVINIVLAGSYLVLQKYYMLFDAMIISSKISKSLNGALGKLNG